MKYLILILTIYQLSAQDIGQKMFNNGDQDSAIIFYERLLDNEDISKDDLVYNLASIYSSIDSLNKAKEYFSLAVGDFQNPSSELNYNYGNMLFKLRDLEGSLSAYRDALLKNPNDVEARKNYEFVKNEIEKNKQENQKNQDQNDDSDESENNENNEQKDQNNSNENKDDKSNNSEDSAEKNSNDDGSSNQESNDSKKQDNSQEREVSIDQSVENILNAMKENEQVNKKRKQKNYSNQSGKEW